jgi:hypothetical protein
LSFNAIIYMFLCLRAQLRHSCLPTEQVCTTRTLLDLRLASKAGSFEQ